MPPSGGALRWPLAHPSCAAQQSKALHEVSIGNSASFRYIAVFHHGTNPLPPAYRQLFENREISMKLARMVLAGAMLTVISSVALAQQALTGTVTTIDRISGTIAIQQTQSGTVGANAGGAAEQFKAQEGQLDTVHVGDKVSFSVSETGGKKTITKIERQ
jgi:Cu/Ag efflux protein CusF